MSLLEALTHIKELQPSTTKHNPGRKQCKHCHTWNSLDQWPATIYHTWKGELKTVYTGNWFCHFCHRDM